MDREPSEEDGFDPDEYFQRDDADIEALIDKYEDEDPDRDHDWLDTPGG